MLLLKAYGIQRLLSADMERVLHFSVKLGNVVDEFLFQGLFISENVQRVLLIVAHDHIGLEETRVRVVTPFTKL